MLSVGDLIKFDLAQISGIARIFELTISEHQDGRIICSCDCGVIEDIDLRTEDQIVFLLTERNCIDYSILDTSPYHPSNSLIYSPSYDETAGNTDSISYKVVQRIYIDNEASPDYSAHFRIKQSELIDPIKKIKKKKTRRKKINMQRYLDI